jgi:hypothetical protein
MRLKFYENSRVYIHILACIISYSNYCCLLMSLLLMGIPFQAQAEMDCVRNKSPAVRCSLET